MSVAPLANIFSEVRNRHATAYHEAGHVVAAWHEGFKIQKVTIVGAETADGFMKIDDPLREVRLDVDNSDRARLKAERAMIVLYAGAEAQNRLMVMQ